MSHPHHGTTGSADASTRIRSPERSTEPSNTAPTCSSRAISGIVLCVLPLENISADPSQEYLGEGMTDEIITDLAELAGPKVISRTSAMQYKGSDCSDRCIVLLRWKGIFGSSSAKYRLALRPGRAWNNDRSNISWG
jgi:hypothetical protein